MFIIKINKIFIIFILFTFMSGKDIYYFNGDRKVLIKHKENKSRNVNACEVYIEKNKDICLYNQIIIKTKNINKIIKEYNLKYNKHLFDDVHLISVSDIKNTLKTANLLYENKKVAYAYPNFERVNNYRIRTDPLSGTAWHLKNTGQERYYKAGADIDIQGAWKIATGNGEGIKIGVLDDGIESDHIDVGPNSGYSIKAPTKKNPEHYETNTVHHGTRVATLMTGLNNNFGSIGIAGGSELAIVNIDRTSKTSDIIDAFTYMLDDKVKADIITNSWGTHDVPAPIVEVINKVANEGRDGKGTIIIFSSGNDNSDLDLAGVNDESEIPSVIGVGGSTPYDSRYHLSDYGSNIDLVAPSESLWVGADGNYTLDSGTSYAAPIVAGIVALMLEVNPELTRVEVRDILIKTADKIGTNVYDENGFNRYYGYGRVDAASAVREAKARKNEANGSGDKISLSVNKGWNLISIPVKKTLHFKDFYTYFDKGSDIVAFKDQSYDFHVKSIFPGQSFWLYSIRKYDVPFIGNEFNLTVEEYNLDLGWNMIGVGADVGEEEDIDSNTTFLKKKLKARILHTYDTQKSIWDFTPQTIKRGEGAFIYKDEI